MAPRKHLAVVVNVEGGVELNECEVPQPRPDEILVKVAAAAQNPTDWFVISSCLSTSLAISLVVTYEIPNWLVLTRTIGREQRGSRGQVMSQDATSRERWRRLDQTWHSV